MKRSILKAFFVLAAASLFSYSSYAASPGRELFDFNGIHLESLESDLPSKYKRLFEPSDCEVDKGARISYKTCSRKFEANELPGVPSGLKHPVEFSLTYMNGRLWQIGFGINRSDYDTFIAMINDVYGPPLMVHRGKMLHRGAREPINGISYTWNKGPHSIATYAFTNEPATSQINFVVIHDEMLKRIRQ